MVAFGHRQLDPERVDREVVTDAVLVREVLGLLTRAGLAMSKAGPGGGYRLSGPPEAISMLEVVEAAEGPLMPTRCILRGGPCRWEEMCAVHTTWFGASEAFRADLRATSLADVAAQDLALGSRGGATTSEPGARR